MTNECAQRIGHWDLVIGASSLIRHSDFDIRHFSTMLDGKDVVLRAWQDGDVPFFQALRNDVDTQLSLMAEPRPHSLSQARAWLENRVANHDGVFFVIAGRAENEATGFVELRGIQAVHGHANLGLCLDRQSRGRGRAVESLHLIEQYGCQVLGLHKIVLQVLNENTRAVRLYDRAGYRQVGILRDHFRCGPTRHDVSIWEKLLDAASKDPPWMP